LVRTVIGVVGRLISASSVVIDETELFNLPPYSPECNPDEYLNQDIKANSTR
jgi:hypothetical protein